MSKPEGLSTPCLSFLTKHMVKTVMERKLPFFAIGQAGQFENDAEDKSGWRHLLTCKYGFKQFFLLNGTKKNTQVELV